MFVRGTQQRISIGRRCWLISISEEMFFLLSNPCDRKLNLLKFCYLLFEYVWYRVKYTLTIHFKIYLSHPTDSVILRMEYTSLTISITASHGMNTSFYCHVATNAHLTNKNEMRQRVCLRLKAIY